MIAMTFVAQIFGIKPFDTAERLGNIIALLHLNVPLFTVGLPQMLTVPLELVFMQSSSYRSFSIVTPRPYFVNIARDRLSKITAFTSAYLSVPERLQIVTPARQDQDDIVPQLGVMYFYISPDQVRTLSNNHNLKEQIFNEIRRDLILIFAMLVNHLGVSVDYLIKRMDIGCCTLVIDK